jgi:hypothetical protein
MGLITLFIFTSTTVSWPPASATRLPSAYPCGAFRPCRALGLPARTEMALLGPAGCMYVPHRAPASRGRGGSEARAHGSWMLRSGGANFRLGGVCGWHQPHATDRAGLPLQLRLRRCPFLPRELPRGH